MHPFLFAKNKRKLFLSLALLFFFLSFQFFPPIHQARATGPTTYYVSNCGSVIGNDSNNGTDPSTPWLTISKVNIFNFGFGDSILFNKGCTWREQLNVPSSGSVGDPITFGAYGAGAVPLISGSNLVASSSWVTEAQAMGANLTTDANLQAYWDMEQGGGASAPDGTSNANTLTNTNGVAQSTNHIQGSYAAAFTALSSMTLSRTDANLSAGFVGKSSSTNTNATMGAWVYFNTVTSSMSVFGKGPGESWGFFLGSGTHADYMAFQTHLDGGYRIVYSNSVMATGTWYHVVGRVNSATNLQEIFINGAKQTSAYTASSTTMFTDATALDVGKLTGVPYLDGLVDEAFVFNRALSDTEVSGIYNHGLDATRGGYNLYYTTGFTQPVAVYENNVAMTAASAKASMAPGSWWWDSANSRVYVRATGDVNPSTENIEIPQRTSCITDTKNYTTITNLACQEASTQGVYVTGNHNIIENTSIQHIRSNVPNIVGGGSYGYSNFGDGIYWKGGNTTIENNTVTDAEWGIIGMISSGATSDANLIQGNTVSNIGFDAIAFATGFSSWGTITNSVAQYNIVHNIGLWGLQGGGLEFLGGGAGATNIIRYNLLYNNGLPNNTSFPLNAQGGASSGTFYGNLVYDNYGPCAMLTLGSGHNNFYNNTCYGNAAPDGVGAGPYLTGGAGNTANTLENNIIYAGPGESVLDISSDTKAGNVFDHNLYYGGGATPFDWGGAGYDFADYKTTSGEDLHSLNADPNFTNAPSFVFTLASSSPAIDAGMDLGSTYQFNLDPVSLWPSSIITDNQNNFGARWDIGAYTYIQTSTPSITMIAPTASSTVEGVVTVSASSTVAAPATIASVQFYLDDGLLGVSVVTTSSPGVYSYNWNTTTTTNGIHALSALATDNYGNATTSSPIIITIANMTSTVDDTPPSVPTGVTAVPISQSEIDLSWASSTDDIGVLGYDVYRNGSLIATTTALSYDDASVSVNTTYGYTVDAFDAAGNVSAQSLSVSVIISAATSGGSGGGGGGSGGGSGSGGGGGGGGGYYVPSTTSGSATISATSSLSTAGMSVSQMESVLVTLEAELRALEAQASIAPSAYIFVRNLTLQSRGLDVQALQQYLNMHGFPVITTPLYAGSLGYETQYFGNATQKALSLFQESVGIAPASGYFGPITRAYLKNAGF